MSAYPYCGVCGGLDTHPTWCVVAGKQAAAPATAALRSASHGNTREESAGDTRRVGAISLDFSRAVHPALLAGVQQLLEEAKARQNCVVPVDTLVLSDMVAEILYYRSLA